MSLVRPLIDQLLTDVSNSIEPVGMISEKLLPGIKVKQSSGKLAKYGNGKLRLIDTRVVGRGKAPRVETVTRDISTTYVMEQHGLEGLVTADDYRNVQEPFRAEEDETNGLTTNLFVGKEAGLASALSDTAIITQNTTLAGSDQFSDPTNSDPLAKWLVAHEAVRSGCGQYPNTAWMDKAVAKVLKRHPQLFDRLGIKYNQTGYMTDQQLAEALEVDVLHIAEGVYNSSKEGQTDAVTPIWGKHMWLGVIPKSASPYQISLGYELTYDGQQPRQVTKWAENNPKGATAVLVNDDYCHFLSNVLAAYLIKNAIA